MRAYLTRRPKGLKGQLGAELRTIGDRYSKSGPSAVPVMEQEITELSQAYVKRGLSEAYVGKKVNAALERYTGRTGNNKENVERHMKDLRNASKGHVAGPIHAGKGIKSVPDMINRVNDICEEAESVKGKEYGEEITSIGKEAVYKTMEHLASSIIGINRTSKAKPQEVVEGLEMGAAYITRDSNDVVKGETYQNVSRIALDLAKSLKMSNAEKSDINSAIGAAAKFEEEYAALHPTMGQSPNAQKIAAFKRDLR